MAETPRKQFVEWDTAEIYQGESVAPVYYKV